uniref:Uncharacterized protein n=1 Tax=Elphidium margaritaceum TaxID=933848 RepID=A0A7S0TBF1_9EUKA
MYQSSAPAIAILAFLEKVLSFDYYRRHGSRQMLTKVFKKWNGFLTSLKFDASVYPRHHVFPLLRLLLRTEQDHACFITLGFPALVSDWIQHFLLDDTVKGNEELRICQTAVTFFSFYVHEIVKYPCLQIAEILPLIDAFLQAIVAIIAYQSCKKDEADRNWQIMLNDTLSLLQQILELEAVLTPDLYAHIVCALIAQITTANWIIPFYATTEEYKSIFNTRRPAVPPLNNEEDRVVVNTFVSMQNVGKSEHGVQQCLNTSSPWASDTKHLHAYRLMVLLQKLVSVPRDAHTLLFAIDASHDRTQSSLVSIAYAFWFYKMLHCAIPAEVETFMHALLLHYSKQGVFRKYQLNVVGWCTFCSLVANNALDYAMLRQPDNFQILLQMTHAIVSAVLYENQLPHKKCMKIFLHAKRNALLKFLPTRFELCLDALIASVASSNTDAVFEEYWSFVAFYVTLVRENEVIVNMDASYIAFWTRLHDKTTNTIQLLTSLDGDNTDNGKYSSSVQCLQQFLYILDRKMKEFNDKTVAAAAATTTETDRDGSMNTVSKTQTKKKAQLSIKLREGSQESSSQKNDESNS